METNQLRRQSVLHIWKQLPVLPGIVLDGAIQTDAAVVPVPLLFQFAVINNWNFYTQNASTSSLRYAVVALVGVPQHPETACGPTSVRTAAVCIPRQTGEHTDRCRARYGTFLPQVWETHSCEVSARGQRHPHTVAPETWTVPVGPQAAWARGIRTNVQGVR
jgi:hypothetical protein